MKKLLLPLCIMAGIGCVLAHQPRLVFQNSVGQVTEIQHPEVSQAFYGNLSGQEDVYTIVADTGFLLYINILVPDLPASRKDFAVDIIEGNDAVVYTRLDGKNYNRSGFFEKFAGDNYRKGPTREKNVEAGTYIIKVSNSNNQGKYSLAIGKIESFSLNEIFKTFKAMPALKMQFFEKPRYTVFPNYVGGFFILILFVFVGSIRGVTKLVQKTHKR